MDELAAQEVEATVNRMREKALSKRQNADNLRGQQDQLTKRIAGLENDAADLERGADAIENVFMAGLRDV